jgi:hypothetical protein
MNNIYREPSIDASYQVSVHLAMIKFPQSRMKGERHRLSPLEPLVLLAIVLSVLLRHTDSDYPFGIFKLFVLSIRSTEHAKKNYSKDRVTRTPLKTRSELRCSGRVGSSPLNVTTWLLPSTISITKLLCY